MNHRPPAPVALLALLVGAVGCAQGKSYVGDASPAAGAGGAGAGGSADGAAGVGGMAGSVDGAAGSTGGAAGSAGGAAGSADGAAGSADGAAGASSADAGVDQGLMDAAPEAPGCPADKPVLDDGICCATGQLNCGGTCVACAPGSVCAGNACACPAASQCTPAVPTGWIGPVAADLTGANTACGAAYPTSIAAGTGPQGAAATCSCTCGACSSGSCSVSYNGFSLSPDCSGTPDYTGLIGTSINDCNTSTPNGPLYTIVGAASTAGATCSVTKNAVNAPAPSWATNARLCTGASVIPGACTAGGVCVPFTAPQKTCIYHTGAMTCPAGYQGSSTTVYTSFSDSRDCSCACTPSGASCTPAVSLVDTSCGCTADTGTPFAQCGSIFEGSTHGFRIDSLNVVVTGTTSFTSSGGVSAASPLTVCCTN